MILEALSNNKNSYFPASLSKLVIMPMNEFKASSWQDSHINDSPGALSPLLAARTFCLLIKYG